MPTAAEYTKLIPNPHPDSINTGLSSLKQSTMMRLIGAPSDRKTVDCSPPTNPRLKAKIVTESVGPFRVTGHKAAVESLRAVFVDVKKADPELYALLGSAGMLCVRLVRGSKSSWSNHSWGFAIDLKIAGQLDQRGNDKVQVGLMRLYPIFHRHGWWWGAEFETEDGMHFEPADETVLAWAKEGRI